MPHSSRQNLYLGKAGQFAVMAECLMRGFNVAVPEVDIGDDLFVINDVNGNYRRIQVKAITGLPKGYGHYAQFQLPLVQLEQAFNPDLIYVFVTRFKSGWGPFIVIQRDTLATLHELHGVGSVVKTPTGVKKLQLSVRFTSQGNVECAGYSLNRFINQFEGLPDATPDDLH